MLFLKHDNSVTVAIFYLALFTIKYINVLIISLEDVKKKIQPCYQSTPYFVCKTAHEPLQDIVQVSGTHIYLATISVSDDCCSGKQSV